MLRIEWDQAKAESNLRKQFDPEHSAVEPRFLAVGTSLADRVLVVIYTDDGSTIRLLSARRATKRERLEYEFA